ncbi:MAG: CRISPR-associated endonuclease Cas2 [Tepidisphaerales bacterium]
MTTRRHILVCYDIADDKRRTAVFNTLDAAGDHIQFSVFLCQLNPRERAELLGQLLPLIHHTQDQILLIDLGPAHTPLDGGIEALGKRFEVRSRVNVV